MESLKFSVAHSNFFLIMFLVSTFCLLRDAANMQEEKGAFCLQFVAGGRQIPLRLFCEQSTPLQLKKIDKYNCNIYMSVLLHLQKINCGCLVAWWEIFPQSGCFSLMSQSNSYNREPPCQTHGQLQISQFVGGGGIVIRLQEVKALED